MHPGIDQNSVCFVKQENDSAIPLDRPQQEFNVSSDINQRLTQSKARLRQRQKLKSILQEAQVQRDQLQISRRRMERILQKEKGDVDNLEGLSLVGLFYSILGTKEERLVIERQEYLAAKLKQEETEAAAEQAQREWEELRRELADYEFAERDYNAVLEEKRQYLEQSGDASAAVILRLTEQLADLQADRKELQEAITAGKEAKSALNEVRSELQAAENWGTWDMLGGGTVVTWAKHARIDDAKSKAQIAQRRLRRFQTELADANQRLNVSLDSLGGFTMFADYFFDGLIADWIVQSKISNASDACNSAIRKVASALVNCQRRHKETENAIRQLEVERRGRIEEA